VKLDEQLAVIAEANGRRDKTPLTGTPAQVSYQRFRLVWKKNAMESC
jgi:hypothetical protein